MIVKLATVAFVLGSAVGVGAMYMTEQWRNARASTESSRQSPEPEAAKATSTRLPMVEAPNIEAVPDDLSLSEIYDRVSHA
jgi:hypothetical protein